MGAFLISFGANDGARTRDNQNHNLGLYQLSYVRRCRREDYSLFGQKPAKTVLFCRFQLKSSPISKAQAGIEKEVGDGSFTLHFS